MPRLPLLLCMAAMPVLLPAQTWETLPDIPIDLAFPVVVELNGNIHVIGGGAPQGATDKHLRYRPATNTWDTLQYVPYRAQQPCGAVLNGKIHYCAGGYPNTGTPLNDHYVYDPTTDAWTAATELPFPTAINEAVALNGRFYVLTGQPDRNLCQSYDPTSGQWTQYNDLPDLNFWYGAVLVAGNTIYRFGGGGYAAPTAAAHVYNTANDSWTVQSPLSTTNHAIAGTAINDSLIYLAGGYYGGADLTEAWLYNTNTQVYEEMEPLPVGRSYHSILIAGDRLYVVGGNNGGDPTIGVSFVRSPNVNVGIAEPHAAATPFAVSRTGQLLKIDLVAGVNRTGATMELIDASGRSVRAADLSNGSVSLSSTGLAGGAYRASISIVGRRYVVPWVVE